MEEARTSAQNNDNSTENDQRDTKNYRMMNPFDVPILKELTGFQVSYDDLLPSTATDPPYLVGLQADPELQEQRKQPQKAERRAANAPIDLRDVLNQKEQKNKLEQLVQKKSTRELPNSYAVNTSPNPSPCNNRRLEE